MLTINYPTKVREAEIQAMLWKRLREANFDTRLNLRTDNGLIPDVVVFKHKKPICIIECKSWSLGYMRKMKWQQGKNSKQINRYKTSFGLPVLLCGCVQAIEPLVKIVASIHVKATV